MNFFYLFICLFFISQLPAEPPRVLVGIDVLFSPEYQHLISGKQIGLVTNHTAVNNKLKTTVELLRANSDQYNYKLVALFAPEHGLTGSIHQEQSVEDSIDLDGTPIYSLHGKNLRPTKEMLKGINLLIYDIQDIGSRSYTYSTTLFYLMEEAAKYKIPVVVLDRPNPINGLVVDGPMLEKKFQSIVGYINVPYCHGMTIGELARFFNSEYQVDCNLTIVPMKGWKRYMSFKDTGLVWIPTSPYMPEATTAFYYPTTGIIGELQIVNIGIGYTLPFKLIGAPWINAKQFAQQLNSQQFPGVFFQPFHYRPFYGRFAHQDCQGVLIVITDPQIFKPVTAQYLILGTLKSLYPKQFDDAVGKSGSRKEMFNKVNGTEEVYRLISEEKFVVWKLRSLHQKERDDFLQQRKKYLIPTY